MADHSVLIRRYERSLSRVNEKLPAAIIAATDAGDKSFSAADEAACENVVNDVLRLEVRRETLGSMIQFVQKLPTLPKRRDTTAGTLKVALATPGSVKAKREAWKAARKAARLAEEA